jgi:hypothetical protein
VTLCVCIYVCAAICDIKPTSMEDLKEVITSSQFCPSDCHQLFYSTSRGAIKLLDTRAASLCDTVVACTLEDVDNVAAAAAAAAADGDGASAVNSSSSSNGNGSNSGRNFFTEITNSISDFK